MQPSISQDPGDDGSLILIRYKGNAGQYFELFERSAQPGEELPPGEAFTIHGNTARLQRDGEIVTLTWIEADTWIELTGMISRDELLKIAEGLVVTQTPQDLDDAPQFILDHEAIEATERASFCDPADYVPNRRNYLGDVPDQKRKGSMIFFN